MLHFYQHFPRLFKKQTFSYRVNNIPSIIIHFPNFFLISFYSLITFPLDIFKLCRTFLLPRNSALSIFHSKTIKSSAKDFFGIKTKNP